jgi:hypothetical protein
MRMPSTHSRTRRSVEDRVADLQAQIAKIKAKAEQQKVKKDPSLRHISGAVRSIDKALKESKDKATREALAEAHATLSACLTLQGVAPSGGSGTKTSRARREKLDPDQVFLYVRNNPGSRSEEIAAELGTDATSLRVALRGLRDDGKVKVEGKARAMRYSAFGRG